MKKEFLKYVLLNVLGMIGLSCYILADTFFIARGLGANGLTALNLAIPVYSLVNGCGLMLGMGGAAKYSVFRGQGAERSANEVFTHTVWMAALFSVFFMTAGIFCDDLLATLLGADEQVYEMTRIYLKVILLFAPAFLFNNVFGCFVRNDGAPGLSMAAMLFGSLFNIVFDYIFVFPLHMGILGAVLATGCAPVVGMLILTVHLRKGNNQFHFKMGNVKLRMAGSILSLGFPSLVTEVASGLVMIIFNMLILRIQGNTGVAAYGIIANLALVVSSIYNGVAQGMQPLVSRCYGKGERMQMRKIQHYAVITVGILSVFIYLGLCGFAEPVAAMFNSEGNPILQRMAVEGLKLYFLSAPFVGYNIVSAMYFTASEKAVPAQILSLMRGFFLVVPMAFLLAKVGGMNGIWMTVPLTELCTAILGIWLFHHSLLDTEL